MNWSPVLSLLVAAVVFGLALRTFSQRQTWQRGISLASAGLTVYAAAKKL